MVNPYLLNAWFSEHNDAAIRSILHRILSKTWPHEVADEVGGVLNEVESIGRRYPEANGENINKGEQNGREQTNTEN